MTELKESFFGHVSDIPDDYQLIDLSQDIRSICDHIGLDYEVYDSCCFFVNVGEGEYTDILYCNCSIPYNTEVVYRIELNNTDELKGDSWKYTPINQILNTMILSDLSSIMTNQQ